MKKNVLSVAFVCSAIAASAQLPYQDKSLSAEARARDLLGRLTLEEKASLMQNASPAIERLGIKEYNWWSEALHGVARNGTATVFPQTIGMAASFDEALLQEVFTAVSDEARAKNRLARENGSRKIYQGLTFWTPNINIFRDPRWGRGQETYGEDPYLTSIMGLAVVRGLQGPEDAEYLKTQACAKHYAVHSGPEWNRHQFNAEDIAPRDLWETYLPAFKNLVTKGNVQEVMCAYNRYEGDPCCGSDKLLTQILRNEWGYQGIVVSDCGAINDFYTKGHHETHSDAAAASAAAVLSGTDVECGSSYRKLPDAVRQGLIRESDIDVSLLRLFKARYELGEMDENTPWDQIPFSTIVSDEHKALALKMAHESIVLLQNNNGILPLNAGQKIAIIGANANDSVMQWANYNGLPKHTETLLSALKRRIPKENLFIGFEGGLVSNDYFVSLFNQCYTAQGNGLDATYYGNVKFEGEPIATAHYSTPLSFATEGNTAFAHGVPLTNFSVRYKTLFHASESRDLEFRMRYLGEYSVIVNGDTLFRQTGYQASPVSVGSMKVQAGKDYHIELCYRFVSYQANLGFDVGYTEQMDVAKLLNSLGNADVVIYAGGISPRLEGEEMPVSVEGFRGGDRTDIQLPTAQRAVIKALQEAGKKVVLVNFSGSAIGLVPETKHCEAIVQAWYPGQEGGTALVDVLLGDYNPSGCLPITFYADTLQLPDFQEYSMKGRTYRYMENKPTFSFGYGLSYTTFRYSNARVQGKQLLVDVENTGRNDGDEVVQLYVQRPDDNQGPVKTLRGFKRVNIRAGSKQTVALALDDETFEWWDAASNTMHPLKGSYNLLCGSSSDDAHMLIIPYICN